MFYDYSRILSYNAFLNFLIGERGVGKTYGASKFVVNQFLKKGEQFAYIRRYKTELRQAVPQFFSSINNNNEFPEHILNTKGKSFYCDGEVCGHAMTLATAQDLKGTNFDKVKTIIFDEFIIETGQRKTYLNDEVFTFLNLLETIARMRDVRVFFLGNAVTITNPYFLYFDLTLPYNNDIKLFKNGLILVQYMKNQEYREAKRKSKLGQLTEGTSYGNYAIENKFVMDNCTFLAKKTGSAKFVFAFKYKGEIFGIWNDYNEGRVYVSYDWLQDTPYMFSCTMKDHSPNMMFLNSARKYGCWKNFVEHYNLRIGLL